jgi:non-specific serine/threonine protein kinase
MLETLRQFGLERLDETGDREEVRLRHGEFFLQLAEDLAARLPAELSRYLEIVGQDYANFMGALEGFWEAREAVNAQRLAGALRMFWQMRFLRADARAWLERVLRMEGHLTEARAKVLNAAGNFYREEVNFDLAERLFEESLEVRLRLGDRRGVAEVYSNLGLLNMDRGDFDTSRAFTLQSLDVMREVKDYQGMAHNLFYLGHIAYRQKDFDTARRHWEECAEADRLAGVKGGNVLLALGMLASEQGDWSEAYRMARITRQENEELEDDEGILGALGFLAYVATDRNDPERAARIWGAEETLRQSRELKINNDFDYYLDFVNRNCAHPLRKEDFRRCWEEGKAMTLDAAFEYACEEAPSASPEGGA